MQKYFTLIILFFVWFVSVSYCFFFSTGKIQLGISGSSVVLLYVEQANFTRPNVSFEGWEETINPPLTEAQRKNFPLTKRFLGPIHSRYFIRQSNSDGNFYAIYLPIWVIILFYVAARFLNRQTKSEQAGDGKPNSVAN